MRALIDGDILRYRCGFAAEERFYRAVRMDPDAVVWPVAIGPKFKKKVEVREWLEHVPSHETWEIAHEADPEPVENCLHSVKLQIQQMLTALETDEYEVFLSAQAPTFRDKLATIRPYKGNRKDAPRPFHYNNITAYLETYWGATVVQDGHEADDVLGMSQVEASDDTVICTIDKDLDMIPGWHYNFVKQEKYFVTEFEGLLSFYTQMLVGDTVDNIVGCPGMGKVGARKLLSDAEDEEDLFNKVYEAYQAAEKNKKNPIPKGKATDWLKENAILLWIKRGPKDTDPIFRRGL